MPKRRDSRSINFTLDQTELKELAVVNIMEYDLQSNKHAQIKPKSKTRNEKSHYTLDVSNMKQNRNNALEKNAGLL